MHVKPKNKLTKAVSQWRLYVLLFPALALLIIFHYIPMYGILIAFKDVHYGQSIFEGTWVGLKHFKRLFSSNLFGTIFKNTLTITCINQFLLFWVPIAFALLIHNCVNTPVRKVSQTISYLPHLLSTVVVVSIIELFVDRESGLINIVLRMFGKEEIYFMAETKYFYWIWFISDIWKSVGSSAVIFIAGLSAVDQEVMEAATIDGASKLQKIWHIEIPTILPTWVLMTIMSMGHLFSLGYEKMLLLQNDLNLSVTEIIGTYVYKVGLRSAQYSFSTAVTLFNNLLGLVLLLFFNWLAKKVADIALI